MRYLSFSCRSPASWGLSLLSFHRRGNRGTEPVAGPPDPTPTTVLCSRRSGNSSSRFCRDTQTFVPTRTSVTEPGKGGRQQWREGPPCSAAAFLAQSFPAGPGWSWQGSESFPLDPILPRAFCPALPLACICACLPHGHEDSPQTSRGGGGRAASSRGQGLRALAQEVDGGGSRPDSPAEVLCG